MAEKKESKFLEYRGKPLVRKGDEIYYGNMSDPFVIILRISGTKTVQDMEVADKVMVQLVKTDPEVSIRERIAKQIEKKGLYNAIDIATIWLERALEKGTA